jgi:uncharacterized protein (UPF0335 family)
MNKTIKVIDLLNKIANGEEVPEKIKWRDKIWIYTKSQQDYLHHGVCFFEGFCQIRTKEFIIDTVEIIEEQEEIDIQSIEEIKDIFIENSSCGEDVKYLAKKYNEILKWAKQLDKKIKEK